MQWYFHCHNNKGVNGKWEESSNDPVSFKSIYCSVVMST